MSVLQTPAAWSIFKRRPEGGCVALQHLLGSCQEQTEDEPSDPDFKPQESGWFAHPLSPGFAGRVQSRSVPRTIKQSFTHIKTEKFNRHGVNDAPAGRDAP